jgi:RNA polymerase sigma-70 factor (ECF subfamily)
MKEELDDLSAIHLVLAGDRSAFRAIVERYGDRIRRFCLSRIGSAEEADDAAQEVFLRAFRSLSAYRIGDSFPSWLFAIAANRLRTRALHDRAERGRAERAGREAAAGEGNSAASLDPALQAERSDAAERVRRAVASLPPRQRDCVELFYFGELSVAETACALGLGEEAVKSRLFRGRAALRRSLEFAQPGPIDGGIL